MSDRYRFHTFPKDSVPLIFGGDLQNGERLIEMNKAAVKLDPFAAFIGGDVVYDNGFRECYCMYDRFL